MVARKVGKGMDGKLIGNRWYHWLMLVFMLLFLVGTMNLSRWLLESIFE